MFKNSLPMMLQQIIRPRLTCGRILELGPGRIRPALKLLGSSRGLDMLGIGYTGQERDLALAEARQLGLLTRVEYHTGELRDIPLPDHSVDAVISFGGLRAWKQAIDIFDEIARVLKFGGEFFLGEARCDLSWPGALLAGCGNSDLRESYRFREQCPGAPELRELLAHTRLEHARVEIRGPDVWIVRSDFEI